MYKEKNMDKKNIVVLFGGVSAEYAISLQSAHAVITHLNTAKYVPVLVGITREGRWLRYRGPAAKLLDDSWCAFLARAKIAAPADTDRIGVDVPKSGEHDFDPAKLPEPADAAGEPGD